MTKRFFTVVVDEDTTARQRDAFTEYLQAEFKDSTVWHHMTTMWMIVDRTGKMQAGQLRDKAMELMPKAFVAVIQAKPEYWGFYSPNAGSQWLHENIEPTDWQ